MKAVATITISSSNTNSGAILAMMISDVVAGDMTSCSMVPASRSFTMAAEATMEPFRIISRPRIPVITNQLLMSPGLKRNARVMMACPRRLTATALTCAKRACNPLPGSPSFQV